jgi:cytochrome c oxidase subunit 3
LVQYFSVFKGIEYAHKVEEHLVPGPLFHFEGAYARHAQIFFSLYFAMTGLHAAHMVIGIGILAVLTSMAWRGKFSAVYYAPVEISGLYWHFVDIVWIFLFPLLYLIGRY